MDSADTPPLPPSRRRFLSRLSIVLSGAIGAVATVPVIGFLLSPLARKGPRVWRSVGTVDQFKVGETHQLQAELVIPCNIIKSV